MGSEMLPGLGGQGLGNPTTASAETSLLDHLFANGFRSKHTVSGNKGSSYLYGIEQTQATFPTLFFICF